MHSKKTAIAILLLASLCFMMIATVYAQTQPSTLTPGVKTGDTFTYSVKALWNSDDPNAAMGDDVRQMNMTDYFKVEVTGISGAQVTLHTIWRFTNGTEVTGDTTRDLDTGLPVSGTSIFWGIYGGNLNVEDRIHPMGIDQLTVNNTQTKNCLNYQREINTFTIMGQFAASDNSSRTFSDDMVVQFDKQTGMMVALHDLQYYTNPEYTETIIWQITDSNTITSSVQSFPIEIVAIVVVVIVVALLVAVVALRRQAKQRKVRFQQRRK
jgi:hypothetical protein